MKIEKNKVINEEYLTEMARIGSFGRNNTFVGNTNEYEVWIFNNEGDGIPHFHVLNKDRTFKCCVQILNNKYFHHDGNEDILDSKLKKNLVLFLNSKHRALKDTNWKYLCAAWDDNNSDYELPKEIYENMPDYTKLR